MDKVTADENDDAAIEISKLLFDTAALRSSYALKDPVDFADRILNIMYANLDIDPETPVSHSMKKGLSFLVLCGVAVIA